MSKFKTLYVTIEWTDNKQQSEYFCAVGEYDECDIKCQEIDELIFYWFDSMEELQEFKQNHKDNADFNVVSYDLTTLREV